MLLRIPSLWKSGLKRGGFALWSAVDDDPQFIFAPRLFAASYLVFEIEDADRDLDPRIYVDRGAGFESNEEIELRLTRNGIYVVALGGGEKVLRARFDPSTYPSTFKFRAYLAYSETAVRGFVGQRIRAAVKAARPLPVCETISATQPAILTGLGTPASKVRTITQHFEQLIAMASARFRSTPDWPDDAPLISFVAPLFNTPARYLDQLLDSFRNQRHGAWELILCDDGSSAPETHAWLESHGGHPALRVVKNAVNSGIASATNLGLSVARGQWVGFIDHDDALAPFAVDMLIETIRENPDARLIYTDEVVADARLEPEGYMSKPAFDPVLLSGLNYINHLSLFQRGRLLELGGLRGGYEGSQDYDVLLRYLAGVAPREVLHLPFPCYLWRRDGASYSVTFRERATQSARNALSETYARDGVPALVECALNPNLHRVKFDPPPNGWPKLSIVVASRDSFALISRLLSDLTELTDYPDLEIIVTDNGSRDARVLRLYEKMRASHPDFRADIVAEPFNFSRQVNRGIRLARGDCILLLNNDIEVIEPGWLKEMVSCLAYPGAGIVGARLLYPNGALQHAGVIMGLGSVAGHWFCGSKGGTPGPQSRLNVRQTFAAVTGACMLISRACLDAVGFLDETSFAIAYNDVDFCMRAGRLGFRVVWTPFATLYHHESASRGSDETRENIVRFRGEQNLLREKYSLGTYADPAYSPWYSRDGSVPRLVIPAKLPPARSFQI